MTKKFENHLIWQGQATLGSTSGFGPHLEQILFKGFLNVLFVLAGFYGVFRLEKHFFQEEISLEAC